MAVAVARTRPIGKRKRQGRSRRTRGKGDALRRGFPFWQVMALLIALTLGALLYVQGKTAVFRERYRLQQAVEEKRKLEMENRRLKLMWATLTSTERLERAARIRFGLHNPLPHEVVRIR